MYPILLTLHSFTRWLVLATLIGSIYKASRGYFQHKSFSKFDNSLRHWTATAAHIQLVLGVILYIKSPVIKYFWANFSTAFKQLDNVFFGLYHFLFMIISVVLITVGSALAKRKLTDQEKYRTILIWFSISLLLIFLAIPWQFSPLVSRPYLRTF